MSIMKTKHKNSVLVFEHGVFFFCYSKKQWTRIFYCYIMKPKQILVI